jgi:hypothetical protein
MKSPDFLQYLRKRIEFLRKTWKLNEGKAFGMWFAQEYFEMDDAEAFESVSVDGGNDKDIDFFHVDHELERVAIAQLKFDGKGTYKGRKNELLGVLHTTDWLKDPEALSREGRPDLASAAQDYLDAINNGYSVEYLYVYCGPDHKDVLDTSRQFNVNEAGNVPSKHCTAISFDNLRTMHEESVDQNTRLESCEIPLRKDRFFEEEGAFGRAAVSSVSGEQLRRLHERFGDRLFERNVRLFLGAHKGGVNAGIRDTLGSDSDRKNFWAYNNGVTFICDDYDLKDNKIKLTNFSIVNGCQTTVSLANATVEAARDSTVLVRFIASPETVIDSIIRFTNSQNPIRLWDLNAQDKLQKRIRRELADLPKPFLYLLRKGEKRQLSDADKKKYKRDGKLQVIQHDLNAQYLAALRGLPAIAYKDKGKVFSTHRDEIFPAQIRAEEIALTWQAGVVAKELVKGELEAAAKNNDQVRIAVLKRGAAFFVLAGMGILLHERNGNTFLNKLKPEVASSKKTLKRLRNYAQIALEWHAEIVSDLVGAGNEIASIVRTQEGWSKIKPKLLSKWKVYKVAKDLMEASLPRL